MVRDTCKPSKIQLGWIGVLKYLYVHPWKPKSASQSTSNRIGLTSQRVDWSILELPPEYDWTAELFVWWCLGESTVYMKQKVEQQLSSQLSTRKALQTAPNKKHGDGWAAGGQWNSGTQPAVDRRDFHIGSLEQHIGLGVYGVYHKI